MDYQRNIVCICNVNRINQCIYVTMKLLIILFILNRKDNSKSELDGCKIPKIELLVCNFLEFVFFFLGDIISSFPLLLEASRFVFIPGPQDPGPENILPRPPLSRLATVEIRKKIPFAEFSTNPCRCVKSWSSDCTIFIQFIFQFSQFRNSPKIFEINCHTKCCRSQTLHYVDIS